MVTLSINSDAVTHTGEHPRMVAPGQEAGIREHKQNFGSCSEVKARCQ